MSKYDEQFSNLVFILVITFVMGHQLIKVYARLRKELRYKSTIASLGCFGRSQLAEHVFPPKTCVYQRLSNNPRFYKVFDINSSQENVFETVAKPVINNVIEGFNGTVLAYGQTGSGKTYSITGSSNNYDERGIIPRSIQYIFHHYEKVTEKPTIYISYLEIYNEVGYDLLYSRQSKMTRILEELPRVSLLEDKKGDAHIRNLNVFPVTTEQEAMRLLFLGDTNRTIAETSANEFSSRSHCIFTVYINLRDDNSANLKSSKLHLVDLAGSERVSKTQSKGWCLQEAKLINLSLHFLQQVILALSESNRTHIPYRNTMLTHILKDSLNGNCVTSMLATLSILKGNIEESISTCRFAQKVSLIATEPIINVLDPQREIVFLKLKIEDLEKKLSVATGFVNNQPLSKQKMEGYLVEVKSFVSSDTKLITVGPNMTEIQFCFKLLKNEVENKKNECAELEKNLSKRNTEISFLNEELRKRDKEIDRIPEHPVSLNSTDRKSFLPPSTIPDNENFTASSVDDEERSYQIFLSKPEISEKLNFYKNALENKFKMAQVYAETIENCQNKIKQIRRKLDTHLNWCERNKLVPELEAQQELYKNTLMELKHIQNETTLLQRDSGKENVRLKHQFKLWLEEYDHNKNYISKFDNHKMFKENLYSEHTTNRLIEHHSYGEQALYKQHFNHYNKDTEDFHKLHYYEPTVISTTRECSTQCIHCCQDFKSDSTIPPSSSWHKFNKSTMQCDVDCIPATKTSNCTVSTVEDDDGVLAKILVATESTSTLQSCSEEVCKNEDVSKHVEIAERDVCYDFEKYFVETDTVEFKEFMKTVTLTGEADVDDDIVQFYRKKFC